MKKKPEQRIIFTMRENSDGKMNIAMEFWPKISLSEAAFNTLPLKVRELQTMGATIGKFVMEALARMENKNGKEEINAPDPLSSGIRVRDAGTDQAAVGNEGRF